MVFPAPMARGRRRRCCGLGFELAIKYLARGNKMPSMVSKERSWKTMRRKKDLIRGLGIVALPPRFSTADLL